MALSATVLTISAVAIATSPPLVEQHVAQPTCDERDGTDVCVHPHYVSLTVPIAQAVDSVLDVVPIGLWPEAVQQTGTLIDPTSGAVLLQVEDLESEADLVSAVALPVSVHVSGANGCDARTVDMGSDVIPQDVMKSIDVQHAIALTIQERAGVTIDTGVADEATGQPVRPPELQALSALSAEDLRAWMDDNAEAIQDCSLTSPDLIP